MAVTDLYDIWSAHWSPDGTQFLVSMKAAGWSTNDDYQIFSMRSDGTRFKLLISAPEGNFIADGRWSPDGRFIMYSQHGNFPRTWIRNVETGIERKILDGNYDARWVPTP